MFFAFLDERDKKVKQNYIFTHVFNKDGYEILTKLTSNGKVSNFKIHVRNLNFGQTTGE